MSHDKIIIKDLHVQAIIGVNANERNIKQNIIITLTVYRDLSKCGLSDSVHDTISYSTLSKSICSYVESSHHYTLEALATGVAKTCCVGFGIDRVKVLVEKPGALKLAKWPGVQIERDFEYFKKHSGNNNLLITSSETTCNTMGGGNLIYLAIGSNMGNRFKNILDSLNHLKSFSSILSTSFMYETIPQYYEQQDLFLNCAVKIQSALNPIQLLEKLKSIEKEMGRQETFRNGPRIIDLDILYYNDQIIKTDQLEIPHKLMWERDFVLMPLSDIAPNHIHPLLHITTNQLKINLKEKSKASCQKVFKISDSAPVWNWSKKTFIMGILNVTPDSFVDGGKYQGVDQSLLQVEKLIKEGADIIDIGGQSTHPNATAISAQEELDRVLPIIKKIREQYPTVPLSIDTYFASVAREAIKAGCNLINDISAGLKDPTIFLVALEYQVPIILNHSQPTPQYLQSKSPNNNGQTQPQHSSQFPSITNILNSFFRERIDYATKLGLYSWQIILDPGLGFYKTYEQSIEILKLGKDLMQLGYPMLIGPSRKGFIGATLAKMDGSKQIPDANSSRRLWGTAACCAIAVGWGVNIIRIHDVLEIRDTILIADSIYQ
ncbi:dihydro-6-hydroxymethylpterin pyrophosphokinase (HPPK) [Tieghemostelium lacteum]|uniref:Dihydro-6-hydroxymethylpterin pyrophosphokinase (HPPK) n=1 Tax=Tieghemostelium lacteum TaxID=361077 RepID=A0A152A3P0_TIELA|nr:dihydro-6-hydroxymethylpterin pyrophosphokinase (HPPK) [Tieghemostelium lacteum]|eukprot:KYR00661.1 dihydro-6-hydroxymethylpterin pyrophosphokinase (HPPK) [Tieghemostelium lacteum]